MKTADQFAVVHYIVLALGITLSAVVTSRGFIPVCPPAEEYCDDSSKYIDVLQLAGGVALGLATWWVGSLGRMLIAHVRRSV